MTTGSPTSCVGSGGAFGQAGINAGLLRVTTEAAPLTSFEQEIFANHRVSSPYGAGWSFQELSRVYRSGDRAWLAHGDGSVETFGPRAFASTLAGGLSPLELARDPVTGEIFVARLDGLIQRLDVGTKTLTTVLSGLPFGAGPQGFAIGYVGGSRRFLT